MYFMAIEVTQVDLDQPRGMDGTTSARHRDLAVPALTGAIAALLSIPMFHRLVTVPGATALGINDFAVHLELSQRFSLIPFRVPAPHPVFYALQQAVALVGGQTLAATLVCAGAVGFSAAALVLIGRRPDSNGRRLGSAAAAAFAAFVLLAEAPNPALQSLGLIPRVSMMPTTHAWGSPTEIVMIPLLLFLLMGILDLLDDDSASPAAKVRLLVLTVMTTLAKPDFVVAMLVGLPLMMTLTRLWTPHRARSIVSLVLAPATAVVIWQYWFVASGKLSVATPGVEFAPFEVVRDIGVRAGGAAFWIAPSIVILAWLVGGRRYFADAGVGLGLSCLAVAVVPMLLLRETGESAAHANVTKSAWIAWFVLHLFTVRFLALEVRSWCIAEDRRWLRPPSWFPILAAFATLSVLVGVGVFFENSGIVTFSG